MTRDDVLAWMKQNGIEPTARIPETFDGFVDLFEAVARRAYAAAAEDTDRINWIEGEVKKAGTVRFERHGREWINMFSITTQHTYQSPSIRQLIDQGIREAGDHPANGAVWVEENENFDGRFDPRHK